MRFMITQLRAALCISFGFALITTVQGGETPPAVAVIRTSVQTAQADTHEQDPIIGHWEGAVVRLGSIQTVAFDFTITGGSVNGTYDIPDLSIFGELQLTFNTRLPS